MIMKCLKSNLGIVNVINKINGLIEEANLNTKAEKVANCNLEFDIVILIINELGLKCINIQPLYF